MGLFDLFRPKHLHSNARVRAEAVRQMGADDAELLVKVAQDDGDPSVRRIALDKIDDPGVLMDIAETESDRALRELARSRAAGIWVSRAVSAASRARGQEAIAGLARLGDQKAMADVASRAELPEVRDAALAELDDDRALAELVRNPSTHVSQRTTALGRILDVETLRSIAVDETRKDVALAALDRLEDPDALEVVATKAKNKSVRTRARKKQAEQAEPKKDSGVSAEDKRRHAERVQLVRIAEKLSHGDEWLRSPGEMEEVQRQWEALGPVDTDTDLVERFERAVKRYDSRRKAHAQAINRKVEADVARAAEKRADKPRADKPRTAAEDRVSEAESPARVDSEAAPEAAPEGSEAAPDSEAAPAAGEAAAEAEAAEHARREAERKADRERRDADQVALTALCDELEKTAEGDKRRGMERLLQRADQSFARFKLPEGADALIKRFHTARQAVVIKLQELREAEDWERWANVPRQEALIAKAQELFAETEISGLSDKLRALQAEWKAVGPVPQKKSQELWNQFKSVCDQIYERVKVERAHVAEEHAVNLKRKQELCEQVEALAESTDWDATAEEIKRLQREWKAVGPVPRKKADALWKRFRSACDRFFERRQPHLEGKMAERAGNLAAKQELCLRAEEMADSTDWQETSMELRQLQRQWRDIGPVPRKDAAELNQRFKAACDRFFDRRKQAREEEKLAHERQVSALGDEIAELMTAVDAEDAVARTLAIRGKVRDLDARDRGKLHDQADGLYSKMLEAHGEAFAGTELDPAVSRQKKAKLVAKAEAMAPRAQAAAPDPSEQTPEQVAQRLRAALAENALSGSLATSTDGRNMADTIAELRESWQQVGPVPGAEGKELEKRFQAACEKVLRSAGLTE